MSTEQKSGRQKDDRLYLRVSSDEKLIVEEAATELGLTTSAFIVREALAAAEEVLADRTRFELSPSQWDAFVARLDEPVRDLPEIRRLLSEPSPFADE